MTEEECVAVGGHCFQRAGLVYGTMPPQYPEQCKHCGRRRVAIPREPYEYRDEP